MADWKLQCAGQHFSGIHSAGGPLPLITDHWPLNTQYRSPTTRLCELQEHDLLDWLGPTAEEKKLLEEALAEFEGDGPRPRQATGMKGLCL